MTMTFASCEELVGKGKLFSWAMLYIFYTYIASVGDREQTLELVTNRLLIRDLQDRGAHKIETIYFTFSGRRI